MRKAQVMKDDGEVRNEIPLWVAGVAQYAIIHVQYENGTTEAWPVVQRVPGGWQSGVHHYPDDAVLDVRPLTLVDPVDAANEAVITEGPLPRRFAVECKSCGTRVGGVSKLEVDMWKLGHDTVARRHGMAGVNPEGGEE